MNGDELLREFLVWLEKARPERFYPLRYVPYEERSTRLPGWKATEDWHIHPYAEDSTWQIVVAKEACYSAYDAVLFRKHGDLTRETIPVEVKADTDVLDDRLRGQLWVHIKNFGKSMLILGKEQAFKVNKLNLHLMLPTEIWAYTGEGFKQITEPISKFANHGRAKISHRALEKAFGIKEPAKLRELSHRLSEIRAVVAALEANQWRFGKEEKFTLKEAKIAYEIFGFHLNPIFCEPEDTTANKTTSLSISKITQKTLES